MINHKLAGLALGLVMLLLTVACGSVGVYDPEATQQAMQGTVTALQGTISALESRLNQQQVEVQVVPATATSIPKAVPARASQPSDNAALSLGQTLDLTPTPTPFTIQPEDQTVILVATLTPTPTPQRYTAAPIIIEPRPGTIVEEQREILLRWSWNGLLKTDEYFDIKIRPDGQTRSAYVAWEQGTAHDLVANLAPGRYYWSVQIAKGYYQNNSGDPEDRVFETFLSPESEPRLLIVAKHEDRKPTRTPTRRPDLNPDLDDPTPTPIVESPDPDPDPPADEDSEEEDQATEPDDESNE
ncbi:MAG TPA: hypothetical protein VGD99_12810 [Anaerolineae bacterium]|jgi:hypothetical protein